MKNKFLKLVTDSHTILVTSHISPDPDAVTSSLLMGRTLHHNFPDKAVHIVLEEMPAKSLKFLDGYEQIKISPLDSAMNLIKPDLMIIVDANNLSRVSRHGYKKIKSQLKSGYLKLAIIDHHEKDGVEPSEVFINNNRPASAEEIYKLLFEDLKLKKPEGYAETTLLGIISDTQRHRFDHPGYRETYRIVSDLLDAGASIEKLESQTSQYYPDEVLAFTNFMSNITDSGRGYTYSYLGEKFYKEWITNGKNIIDIKNAGEEFANRYLKTYAQNAWGFIVSPEPLSGKNWWGVSLRAQSGVMDVSKIAKSLGGGGHKPAAGAKIYANSVNSAVNKVVRAINETNS